MATEAASVKGLVDVNTRFGYDPRRGVMVRPEEVKRAGQRWGVVRAYTCSLTAVLFDCEQGNQETLELCARDGFFRPVAVASPTGLYSPQQPARAREQGFAMVRLFPDVHDYAVESAACARLVEAYAGAGMPVMLPNAPGRTGGLSHLLRGREGKFILTGNTYPVMGELLALAESLPTVYVELSGVSTPDGLEVIAGAFSPGRMLWGSGYPMLNVGSAAMVLAASGLTADEIELVGGGNARRLLERER
jgi:predicted TIM-barrel fold metal-dependent hydrolase